MYNTTSHDVISFYVQTQSCISVSIKKVGRHYLEDLIQVFTYFRAFGRTPQPYFYAAYFIL